MDVVGGGCCFVSFGFFVFFYVLVVGVSEVIEKCRDVGEGLGVGEVLGLEFIVLFVVFVLKKKLVLEWIVRKGYIIYFLGVIGSWV